MPVFVKASQVQFSYGPNMCMLFLYPEIVLLILTFVNAIKLMGEAHPADSEFMVIKLFHAQLN